MILQHSHTKKERKKERKKWEKETKLKEAAGRNLTDDGTILFK